MSSPPVPSRPWGSVVRWALLAVCFGVASYGFYHWRRAAQRSQRPGPPCAVAVTIEVRQGALSGGTSLALADAVRAALAPASLQSVLESVDGPHADGQLDAAQVAESLRVDPTAGRVDQEEVCLTFDDPSDSAQATRVLHELARRSAEAYRAAARDQAQKIQLQAQQGAEDAQRQYVEAHSNLENFLTRHFQELDELLQRLRLTPPAAKTEEVRVSGPVATSSRPAEAPMIVNPERVALENELAQMQQLLARMLTVRTPLHPEVQDLQARIADLGRKLDLVPGQILAQPAAVPELPPEQRPPVTKLPPVAAVDPQLVQRQSEMAQTYATLNAALCAAARGQQRAAEAEREAWQALAQGPELEIKPAVARAAASVAPLADRRLWIALGAALMLTTGLGMIALGLSANRPLRTAAEVQSATGLPVVSTLHLADLPEELRTGVRPSRARSIAFLAAGMLLVLGCAAAMWA